MVVILKLKLYHVGFLRDLLLDPYYLFYMSMTYQWSRINLYQFNLRIIQKYYLRDIYNINSIVTSLNYELGKLIIWLIANKLSINMSITHYMVFHKDIILNNYILQQVPFTK